jgi:anti-sigma-K factor RskA
MTAPFDFSPEDEADALAAEYVLGVLSLEDRLVAEARLKTDQDFASRVSKWETHFEALNDNYASTPAPDLMPMIEARIFGKSEAPKRSWWGFLAGAGVAAALAVAVVVNLPPSGSIGPVLTASLEAQGQELAFNASYADGTLTLAKVNGPDAGAGRDYELWVIIGDAAPVSLGVIASASSTRTLGELPAGATLAVSLEKAGGSTTGAPDQVLLTGVVIAS